MADTLRLPVPPAGGPLRRSPAGSAGEDLKALPPQVRLREVAFPGVLVLRGSVETLADPVAHALALRLDAIPGVVLAGEGAQLLCLDRDEWLAVVPSGREDVVLRTLSAALEGQAAAVLDVSDAHWVVDLEGPLVREVLSKGCPLDIHPRAFPPGRCARTTLAGVPVVVQSLDDGVLRLFAAPSMARWLGDWFLDQTAEY